VKRYTKFRKSLHHLQDFDTKGWIPADQCFDTMRIASLEILHGTNPGICKLAHIHNSYSLDLFHLQRAIIPDSRSKAPLEHQGAVNTHRITETDLTIDDASNQGTDVLEHDLCFHGILRPMFCHLTLEGYVGGPKNGLNNQRDLVRRQIQIDRYTEANGGRLIN
jgi:hypothetical protein